MNDLDNAAFIQLFKDACRKCFGHSLQNVLSETESKHFCNHIIDKTGLIIGFKSIKNYSVFVLGQSAGKQENPSIATLDTLARYVMDAPYTDEIKRKTSESHYPYWFSYKDKFLRPLERAAPVRKKPAKIWMPAVGIALLVLAILFLVLSSAKLQQFAEDFHSTNDDTLVKHGWKVQAKDAGYWYRRGEKAGCLSLFTLKGDSWPDSTSMPGIKNLLLRPITADCFTAEVHFSQFVPAQNWQQAGILLLEDTDFKGKSLRLSLAYNDFAGAYPKSRQVVVQAVTSLGKGFGKPEEIAHTPVLYFDSLTAKPGLINYLDNSALRIEKHNQTFRLLYSGSSFNNAAFKEIITQEFNMQPKYIALFAFKGFVDSAAAMPVHIKYFSLIDEDCK